MKLSAATLEGIHLIEIEPRDDSRGRLLKVFDESHFRSWGLNTDWAQHLVSQTRTKGTIRGMHWQTEPEPETKLVRCSKGRIHDVVVDVRSDSATFGQWEAFPLSGNEFRAIYVPPGFAHGFQTLSADAEVSYLISSEYRVELQRGLRWNDELVQISWPLAPVQVSTRDSELPTLGDLKP